MKDNPEYFNENNGAAIAANGGESRFILISEPKVTDFYTINSRRKLTQYGTHQIIVLG